MAEDFLSDFDSLQDDRDHSLQDNGGDRSSIPPGGSSIIPPDPQSGDPQRLRMILVGTAENIRLMIHRFHVEGVAAVGDWSRILPVPNSTEAMSILILRISRDQA